MYKSMPVRAFLFLVNFKGHQKFGVQPVNRTIKYLKSFCCSINIEQHFYATKYCLWYSNGVITDKFLCKRS